jgi:predicted dehydrogenase
MAVRVGIIGAGSIGQIHLDALLQMPEAQVVGIYDVDARRTAEAAGRAEAVACGSVEELLNVGLDALYICTPQFARDETEAIAAERGIHVFVEKPLGLELEAVIRKEERIRRSGVVNAVGYCLRYYDTVEKAKEYLRDKQVDMVVANRIGGLPPQPWLRQQHLCGGQLVDQTTHQIDLVRYLTGEFAELYAKLSRRSIERVDPQATVFDVGTIAFSLDTGAVGSIYNTCLVPVNGRGEVEIFGRNFYVGIRGATVRIVDERQDVSVTSRTDVYAVQARRFIDAVRTGDPGKVLCSYSDGLKTLAVTLAAGQSAQLGRPVRLSEDKFRFH